MRKWSPPPRHIQQHRRKSLDAKGEASGKHLPLRSLPPVLLSETYGDLQRIAHAGSGYNPDWEKHIW